MGTTMATLAAAVLAMTLGVTPANGGSLSPPQITINNGAGLQQDPHVDGNTAAYSNEISDANGNVIQEIRYFDFATNSDVAIPNALPNGTLANDLLSDVDQGRIVFTRLSDHAGIMLFDVATATLTELAYSPGSFRMGVAIGGNTAAFIDFSTGSGELKIYDLAANTLTHVTNDAVSDANPAVSPDGNTVTWERCETANCDIYRATRSGSLWLVSQVSSSLFTERSSDTNGSLVVFQRENSAGATGTDIVVAPLGGGPETVLEIPGDQYNPSIRGGLVAFESRANGEADLYLVELSSNRLFRVTETPGINESLNDVTVLPNGEVRLVWEADTEDPITLERDANIYAATFSLQPAPAPTCRSVVLEATRFHSPTRSVDGDVTFSPAMRFAIPGALPVVAGNAGNKKAYLTIELANKTIECEYRSRAHQSHPSTPSQLALASSYVLVRCEEARPRCGRNGDGHDDDDDGDDDDDDDDDGHGGGHGRHRRGGNFTSGTIVTALSAHLHIQNGDTRQPMTRVRVNLAEICSTSSTSSPLQAGNDLDGPQAAGCSSSGAALTPFVIALAFLALMLRRPTAIRLVTRQEQRRLPR